MEEDTKEAPPTSFSRLGRSKDRRSPTAPFRPVFISSRSEVVGGPQKLVGGLELQAAIFSFCKLIADSSLRIELANR
jgi:hypothetical protein